MNPSRLASALRSVAERIDLSMKPSRSAVARELRRLLAAMGLDSVSVDDLKSILVAQVHAFDVGMQDFVSSDIGDKVALVDKVLRSRGVEVIDLTGRGDLPASSDPDSLKVAVDLHFIDGNKTYMVVPDASDSSGIRSFVDSVFDDVYSALGEAGIRLPDVLSSPFEPDHYDVKLIWDGSSFSESDD